jgi:hypothetical protein
MAKKKQTPQQRQLASLVKNYQANIAALGPEYEKLFAEKQAKMGEYNKAIESYSQTLADYNQKIADFKANKVAEWVPANVVATTTSRRGVVQNYIDVPTWFVDYDRSRFMPSGETYSGRLGAEGMIARGGTPIKQEGGKFYLGRLAEMPKKLTAPEPSQPDFSGIDKQMQELESKKQATQQTLERETSERRSARLRAVTQGSRDRPMLSKGVTLNG